MVFNNLSYAHPSVDLKRDIDKCFTSYPQNPLNLEKQNKQAVERWITEWESLEKLFNNFRVIHSQSA